MFIVDRAPRRVAVVRFALVALVLAATFGSGAASASHLHRTVTSTSAMTPIDVQRVEFDSDGETVVGLLFSPAWAAKAPHRVPAVLVTGSWISVKEQIAASYARRLAESGFIALAFDFRHFGESGGWPRQWESPQLKQRDIDAAARWLRSRVNVADGAVGGLSLCASAGYMAHAIAAGAPIRAFATIAARLHDPSTARRMYSAQRYDALFAAGDAALSQFRTTGRVRYVRGPSMTDPDAVALASVDQTSLSDRRPSLRPRGLDDRVAQMSWVEWLSFDALDAAPLIRVPTAMVFSRGTAMPGGAARFFTDLGGDRALYWLNGEKPDCGANDLPTDDATRIVTAHFRKTLAPVD